MLGPEEGRHMHHRSQNGAGGGAIPKRTGSLAWGKKGLVERWTYPMHGKVWEVDWSSWENTLSTSHPSECNPRGTKKPSLACGWLVAGLLVTRSHAVHSPVLPTAHGLQKGVSLPLCLAHLVIRSPCIHALSCLGACDLVTLAAARPMVVQAPHTGSRREP